MDQVFLTLPLARSIQRLKKCNKEITVGRINVTKVQKLVRDTLLRGYDIYPKQSKNLNKFEEEKSKVLFKALSSPI